MAAYQVKVFYGDGFKKCGMIFLSFQEFFEFNCEMLTNGIKEVTRAFQHGGTGEIRIRYLDDKGCFVNFDENLTNELFRCAKDVPGADWKRITLQAEIWNSPAPKSMKNKQQRHEDKDRELGSCDASSVNYGPRKKMKETYTTPVEGLVALKEEEIRKQEKEIESKSKDILALEQAFSSIPLETIRPACSKCHLRAGHTRANCSNAVCISARFCGDRTLLKRHPEEKKQIKDLKSDLQLMRSKLQRTRDELSNLRSSIKSSKRTFAQLIHSNLVNSDKDKYIYSNGALDWLKLNTEAKKIEKNCEGKVPDKNANLQELIAKHDSRENLLSTRSSHSKSSNPVKQLWEHKGVPGTGPIYWSPLPKEKFSVPVPESKEEEDYQMRLALRESQFTAQPVCTDTQPRLHELVPANPLDTLAEAANMISEEQHKFD